MTIPEVGLGFGATYIKPTPTTPKVNSGRSETHIDTVVGGNHVTMVIRNDITPEDPFDNLARAAAFSISTGQVFPAPRVPRSLKDHLIRTNISI